MKRTCLLSLCLFLAIIIKAQPLAEHLEHLINHTDFLENSEVGISVYNLTQKKQVYAYQDTKLYRPASIEKIITSVTALHDLGTEYRFRTQLSYTGTITPDGVLKGDLYVNGGFDPEFMEEDMDKLAAAVYDAGIRAIDGSVTADVSMTDSVHWGTGWAWDDTPEAFQPYLSPLMLNRGCVNITVTPGQNGYTPKVKVIPESDYYRIDNKAVSHSPSAGRLKITRDWISNGNTFRIRGNATKACTETLNVYSSKDFFLQTLCYKLQKQGIQINSKRFGVCPEEAEVIALTEISHNLDSVLHRALKKSDNLNAEAMFYALGAEKAKKKGIGFQDAQKAIYHFMKWQLERAPHHYKIVDGSGVSMYNYISPSLMMAYLKYAYHHTEIYKPFYDALPIAGIDGTLQFRMKKGKAFNNVHAKTGTVTGVSSLAGYVKNSAGDMIAFVIINQNILNGKDARNFQDKICELLAQ